MKKYFAKLRLEFTHSHNKIFSGSKWQAIPAIKQTY